MSYRNQEYWCNKNEMAKKAQNHYLYMEHMFIDEIKYSEENSMIFSDVSYDYDMLFKPRLNNGKQNIEIIVDDIDTVSALFKYKEGKTAVLNFASYKHPGGMFLKGSSAQEENLCHHSTLFNVLKRFVLYYKWNSEHLNKALYTNRAIVSPNILFFSPLNSNYKICCDVITCAAPNKHTAQKYQKVSDEENTIALGKRIAFVMDIANYLNVETLILGAYGCGVFGQDPYQVSMMFKQYIDNISCPFHKVIFAIPDSYRNNNLEAFRKTFHE